MKLAIVKPAKKGSKGDPNQEGTPNLQKAPSTGTVQLPLTVPAQVKREFKSYAAENDFSMSALFQRMWDEYRARHPQEHGNLGNHVPRFLACLKGVQCRKLPTTDRTKPAYHPDMERPDESLIKDADLRRELERHRHRTGGANGMFQLEVRMLVEKQEERDAERARRAAELAAMPREKRRRAIVREVFENTPPSPADVRHIHSVLAVCGLPYDRQPLDTRVYERRQGKMSLLVKAGEIMAPDGEWKQQPLPYGPKARLILMHLCTEALHNNTPTIELADTFTAFVQKLGFSKSGGERGPLTAFKHQLNALAACDLRMGTWNGTTAKTRSFKPINDFDVWLSDNPDQRSLWPSTVTFSDEMFESLKRHAIPVNIQAIKAIQGSARKLDLYFWLGYRLNNIEETLHISWQALSEQFGTGFTRPRDFHRKLGEEIAHIKEIFPRLPIKLNEQGITLQPAGPDVLTLPAPRPVKSR